MGSPKPEFIKLNSEKKEISREEIGELYKQSYRRFVENLNIQNSKVRYYFNKTMAMRQPLSSLIEELTTCQRRALAFVDSDPPSIDAFLLSALFCLIEKVALLIDWRTVGQRCIWEDFQREAFNLRALINEAQTAAFECSHAVLEKGNAAVDILAEFQPVEGKRRWRSVWIQGQEDALDIRLKNSNRQESLEPLPNGILVSYQKSPQSYLIEWEEDAEGADAEARHSMDLGQASNNFLIRFLRLLLFHARQSLELVSLTLSRIEVSVRNEFPLEKLQRCSGLHAGQLPPHERAILFKAKKEFDVAWNSIMVTVTKFRFLLDSLSDHSQILKHIAKQRSVIPQSSLIANHWCLPLDDPLLFRLVETEASLSPYANLAAMIMTERTEDQADMIHEMWDLDKTNAKTIYTVVLLLYSAFSQVLKLLNVNEKRELKDILFLIFLYRDKAKRNFKKALKVFNHPAFTDMNIHNHNAAPPTKSITSVHPSGTDTSVTDSVSLTGSMLDSESGSNHWVKLPGGIDISIGDKEEFLVLNNFKDKMQFGQLLEEEQITVMKRMTSKLSHCVAHEALFAKTVYHRASETKSLVKRIRPQERNHPGLNASVANGLLYIKNTVQLLENMNILLSSVKK